MSVIATALKHMLAAGMDHAAIVSAVEAMEAEVAVAAPALTARQARNRRYYDKSVSEKRLKSSEQDTQGENSDVSDVSDASPPPPPETKRKVSPCTPSKEKTQTPSPPPIKAAELFFGQPSANGRANDDVVLAFDAWNILAAELGLPKSAKLTSGRRRHIGARLKDAGGLEGWMAALEAIRASPFCQGRNDRAWQADLNWLITEGAFVKLMEGRYAPRPDRPQSSRTPIMQALDEHVARIRGGDGHHAPTIDMDEIPL